MNRIYKSALVAAALLGALFPANVLAAGTAKDGEKCTTATDCVTVGATCVAPVAGGDTVCTPPAPAAAKLADGATCSKDEECDSGFCDGTTTKSCAAQRAVDEACTRNEGCISAACLKDKCVQCLSDKDCSGADICQSNKCVVPPGSVADGDACTKDGDCASGDCVDSDNDSTEDKCAPKAPVQAPPPTAPVPPPAPTKPTIPVCPTGFVATEFPPASGSYVCIPSAPQPTAPVQPAPTKPAPVAPAPAPTPAEVCASFPMSDLTSSDASDQIFGCVAFAAAQVCGTHKAQTWGDCAVLAQRVAKGGAPSLQRFFAAGLGLVKEKLWNRSSHWRGAKSEVEGMDAMALRSALRSAPEWVDLLRLATGTVTGGQRGIGVAPRRVGKPTALDAKAPACTGVSCQPPPPTCPHDANPAIDASGKWGCVCQPTGLWVPPDGTCR